MLETKVIDIHLPDCDEHLKIRRVNTSKAIALLGYVPDILIPKNDETDDEKRARAGNPKNIEAFANWACKGIVVHGSKNIVPKADGLADNEFSYYDLSETDQAILLQAVISGIDPSKKKEMEPVIS